MNRKDVTKIVHRLDEVICALNDVRRDLIAMFGDDCGLGLAISGDAPQNVRRMVRRVADRTPALRLVTGSEFCEVEEEFMEADYGDVSRASGG